MSESNRELDFMSELLLNHEVMPIRAQSGAGPELIPGIGDFTYADLYDPSRLRDLADFFYRDLKAEAAELGEKLETYIRTGGQDHKSKAESELLIAAAPYLSRFIAKFFNI